MKIRSRGNLHKPDYTLVATLAVIVIFGLIMLSSASTVLAYQKFNDSYFYLKHQLLFGVLFGVAGCIIISRVDYHLWKKFAFPLMIATIIALVMVLIPGIGFEYGGARRWINFGVFLLQPSEVAKFTFLMYLATWLENRDRKNVSDLTYGFVPFVTLLGIIGLLIMLQPDMGTMSVITIIALSIYFIGGAHLAHVGLFTLSGLGLLGLLIKIAPYRVARLTTFLNPELDPQGIGYHINQALLAIGSGGIFGLGLGHSRQKYNYLPEVTGDSIFAVMAEELGFVLATAFILLYFYLMLRCFRVAKNAPDTFGRLIAVGITVWFLFQMCVNIGAMVSLLPLTGIPLPFVSYGSSAMITSFLAIGILINISRQTKNNGTEKRKR